ncbi:MAG: hypothetical protein ACYC8W_03485 [Candidatus Tyrphobacter sp.]
MMRIVTRASDHGEFVGLERAARLLTRVTVPLFSFLLVVVATQATIANLPSDKVFAGHDSGFYTLFPHRLARLSTQAWEVNDDLGAPSFEGLVTQPIAALDVAMSALHLNRATMGRAFFGLEMLLVEFGTFFLLWLLLKRAFPHLSTPARGFVAFFGTMVATFNIYTALLFMYPPSGFQLGILIWPLAIATELYLLWERPRRSTAVLFALLLATATWGNPAHTLLGIGLVTAIYFANGLATRTWYGHLAAVCAAAFVGATAYFWLPALSSMLLYPGGALSNVPGVDARSLAAADAINASRTSIGALLRFDGLIWWPKTRDAGLFASWPLIVTTGAPAMFALAALFSRSTYGIAAWVLLLVGVELAKGAHPPFALDLGWAASHVPILAAFRQTYDKFTLYILISLPAAFAIGCAYLWGKNRVARAIVCLGFAAAAFNAWPFLAGRAADPYFLTTLPPDYARVDRLVSVDTTNRVLSLPGAPGGINVTSWFKGGQFETFLFRAKTLNAATFKERSISAASLYDDFSMEQARELPELIGLLGIYHINFVLLHKDYLTSYQMAFDHERYKVLGPLVARASERFLDEDRRLQKIYEGPDLVLYRVRSSATLPYAYGTYSTGVQTGYENALLGTVTPGVMDPSRHPLLFVAGNQRPAATQEQEYRDGLLMARSGFLVASPVMPESPALYPNEISLPAPLVSAVSRRLLKLRKPTVYVFVQPHGDWLNGGVASVDNIDGRFSSAASAFVVPRVTVEARRIPRQVTADFVGTEGRPAWPVSPFFAQPAPNIELVDGAPIHDVGNTVERSIVSSMVIESAAVAYQLRLKTPADYDEVIAASGPRLDTPLLDDPQVSFLYAMPTPDVEAAWLRFELRGPGDRLVYFDKQLDASGHLDNYDIRDAVQAALDARFNRLVSMHADDRAWLTARRYFNAEQAEDYRLAGVDLVVGKRPGFNASTVAGTYSFKMRGLVINLAGLTPPAYPSLGYHGTFASVSTHAAIVNLQDVFTTRRQGALLVNAAIQDHSLILNESLVGRSAAFRLRDGRVFTADVLSELPDAYVVSTSPGEQTQLFKSAIDSVAAINEGLGTYSITMNLPNIDLMKYPQLRVRYNQGSDDEQVRLRIGLDTPRGLLEITPSYDIDPKALDETTPAEWIHPASPLGFNPVIALDGNAVVEPDTGWREMVCDMRQIESLISTLKARPRYIKLTFALASDRGAGQAAAYSFGFGDVAFLGEESAGALVPPTGRVLTLDSRPLRIVSESRVGGTPDLLDITFAPVRVGPGQHRLDTAFPQPWRVRSAALIPEVLRMPIAEPSVRITRIDDLLYAVHITANAPSWIAFAETYNNGWRLVHASPPATRWAWLRSLQWLRPPVQDHLVGNAYDNAWYIRSSGDYVIDFAPQNFAILGRAVAIVTVILSILLAVLWRDAK